MLKPVEANASTAQPALSSGRRRSLLVTVINELIRKMKFEVPEQRVAVHQNGWASCRGVAWGDAAQKC